MGIGMGFSSMDILGMFLSIPAILIVFTAKEYIRARMAYKLGDKAQKLQGRMTLDPFAHIDIMGFILIIITGFGWSKPAYVNRNAFKKPKEDSVKVTLAAFSSYLIVAIMGVILKVILIFVVVNFGVTGLIMEALGLVINYIISVSISLFVFNLIPMPGLEMHNLLKELAPGFAYRAAEITAQYNFIILLAIVIGARFVISPPVGMILHWLDKLTFLLVNIIL